MSILTREEILKEIQAGNIQIQPFEERFIGPASIDLRLGRTFRVFKALRKTVIISNDTDYRDLSAKIELDQGEHLLLMPGETVLGVTEEKITLSPGICGWLEGRSRFARIGLLVHISASFMQPGISNNQVLEMSNFGPNPLELLPGTVICQFIFQKTIGMATYYGTFKNQSGMDW